MYNGLLNRVVSVINNTVAPSNHDDIDTIIYTTLFSQERAAELLEEKREKRRKADLMIAGATGLAVIGELAHMIHRSGVIGKLKK